MRWIGMFCRISWALHILNYGIGLYGTFYDILSDLMGFHPSTTGIFRERALKRQRRGCVTSNMVWPDGMEQAALADISRMKPLIPKQTLRGFI